MKNVSNITFSRWQPRCAIVLIMYKEDKKTNMGRKQIYFKLPEDLLQAIQVKADEEQTSATEIVRKALTSYLSPEKKRLKE